MKYAALRSARNDKEYKQNGDNCQAQSIHFVHRAMPELFVIDGLEGRLKELFGVETAAELAERMDETPQTLDHWLKGRRKFPLPKLLEIARSTGCSLDELLLDRPGVLGFLVEVDREVVKTLAVLNEQPVHRIIETLVRDGLEARADHLYARSKELKDTLPLNEWQELEALLVWLRSPEPEEPSEALTAYPTSA